jgi:xylan 1,4-beta-xylosidase
VDAGKSLGELTPIWRFFGADEPNYAYMKDGKKLSAELGQLGGRRFIFAPSSAHERRRRVCA